MLVVIVMSYFSGYFSIDSQYQKVFHPKAILNFSYLGCFNSIDVGPIILRRHSFGKISKFIKF